ncbi:hypothetical protein B484DRAFT_225915, partial [Ochromonadaceae sp. CCMP2298]
MSLVEVQLQEHTLLLACDELTTVASLTAAALSEYLGFNLKRTPQKVLYTRDSQGRVLGGALLVLQCGIEQCEVVIADHSAEDVLGPAQTATLYRDWQLWTSSQVQRTVHALAVQDVPPRPAEASLSLLFELSLSPCLEVQQSCLRALQLLLVKFPQKDLVLDAAQRISRLFLGTQHAAVAVAAVQAFQGLSPLQAQVFRGQSGRALGAMLDVQAALMRFPPEQRGPLFAAFEGVSAIMGDEELAAGVAALRGGAGGRASALRVSDLTAAPEEEGEGEGWDKWEGPSGKGRGSIPKRINLKRLESLLCSQEAGIRTYALAKLLKMLSQSAQGWARLDAEGEGEQGHGHDGHTNNMSSSQHTHSAPSLHSPAKAYELGAPDTRGVQTQALGAGASHTAAGGDAGTGAGAEGLFAFTSSAEVRSLVGCLFRTLKAAINARKRGEGEEEGSGSGAGHGSVTAQSKAGRLIQGALLSPHSDPAAAELCVDCLWLVAHFPRDPTEGGLGLGVGGGDPIVRAQRGLRPNNAPLSPMQMLFASAAGEWARLLLTLAHADEGSASHRGVLAEKSAYFFAQLGGWASQGGLEGAALLAFLSCGAPSHRLYLGLSFLHHLAATAQRDTMDKDRGDRGLPFEEERKGRGDRGGRKGGGDRKGRDGRGGVVGADSQESLTLQRLLSHSGHEVCRLLWRWGTGVGRGRRLCCLLSMEALAYCSVFSSVNVFLRQLDPIRRLAAMLRLAIRDLQAEQREFPGAGVEAQKRTRRGSRRGRGRGRRERRLRWKGRAR